MLQHIKLVIIKSIYFECTQIILKKINKIELVQSTDTQKCVLLFNILCFSLAKNFIITSETFDF